MRRRIDEFFEELDEHGAAHARIVVEELRARTDDFGEAWL